MKFIFTKYHCNNFVILIYSVFQSTRFFSPRSYEIRLGVLLPGGTAIRTDSDYFVHPRVRGLLLNLFCDTSFSEPTYPRWLFKNSSTTGPPFTPLRRCPGQPQAKLNHGLRDESTDHQSGRNHGFNSRITSRRWPIESIQQCDIGSEHKFSCRQWIVAKCRGPVKRAGSSLSLSTAAATATATKTTASHSVYEIWTE